MLVNPDYCFNLHFPDDIWCRASFHMLSFHPYVCFWEVSVKVFGLFFLSQDVYSYFRVWGFLYVFWIIDLYLIGFVKYFLTVCDLSSQSPISIFLQSRSFWFLWSLAYQLFLSWIIHLVLYLKNHQYTQGHLHFLLKIY